MESDSFSDDGRPLFDTSFGKFSAAMEAVVAPVVPAAASEDQVTRRMGVISAFSDMEYEIEDEVRVR